MKYVQPREWFLRDSDNSYFYIISVGLDDQIVMKIFNGDVSDDVISGGPYIKKDGSKKIFEELVEYSGAIKQVSSSDLPYWVIKQLTPIEIAYWRIENEG